ncbi:MAG: ATP-dependent RecD-like DNA helicase, partial [Candidatus Cloacimonetes bacterium]|nr:ATP-dependent RecD-like DNA helicase [Candidatus Cloacimonadota bacterium]
RVFQHYGPATIEKIQEDPYSMTREVRGVGFKTADSLALGLGFGSNSSSRLRAGILHCLQEWQGNGHCAIPIPLLLEQASKLLEVDDNHVQKAFDLCLQEEEVQITGDLVQEKILASVEKQISMRVATLLYTERLNLKSHLNLNMEKLSSLQKAFPEIILSEEQHETLRRSVGNSLSVITGGPGVGKTTILKILTYLFVSSGCKVKLCAPTGKAARRMESVTRHSASTLHKLLQYKGSFDFAANEENPLEGDVFIVDEASMLDIWLFYALLKALPADATLILVGDVDQLPSVGPGHVLRDLIETELVPVSCLKQIFRQQKTSGIIAAAHSVNRGIWVEPEDSQDFYFIEADNPKRVQELLLKMLVERIPKRYGLHPVLDIQILAPMYRGDAGIDSLNRILQETLNPHEQDVQFGTRLFRAGDKVMQLENNYDKEVFNGDQGMIEAIDPSAQQMAVRFEDKVLVYTRSEIEELTLCYAASVHKVQGSEFSCVILVLMNSHFTMLKRNLVYTAITRGKSLVIVLGQKRALMKAVEDTTGQSRITLLKTRILDLIANLEG